MFDIMMPYYGDVALMKLAVRSVLGQTEQSWRLTVVDDQVSTKLVQRISQIPGVAQVTIGGQQTPAIRIQLDPAKLVAKNLSLEEVRTPLSIAISLLTGSGIVLFIRRRIRATNPAKPPGSR